jgi:hypothetical protein
MSCYENLVMKTQMNYSRYYSTYAAGGTAVVLSKQKPLPYEEQIQEFVRRVQEAECIVVGGASGLSAAGGGDFYYSDTPSFREHFGKFADKYGFKGAFSGMMHRFSTRNEHWGYVSTFLNTTQNAPIREPDCIYSKFFQIIQSADNSWNITYSISVRILKAFRINLIYDCIFPPFILIFHTQFRYLSGRLSGSTGISSPFFTCSLNSTNECSVHTKYLSIKFSGKKNLSISFYFYFFLRCI